MKVYFTASARGRSDLEPNYQAIYHAIEQLGCAHLDDLVLKAHADDIYALSHPDRVGLYEQTVKSIKAADIVVLEVSKHSLSMGFVMQKSLEMNKPVILLHVKGCQPLFAAGIENEKLQLIEYQLDNLKRTLEHAIDYARDTADTRFNFFISPSHINYLDWIAKNRKIPRSVYLRELIDQDKAANEDYNG